MTSLKPRESSTQFNLLTMQGIYDRAKGRSDEAHRHDYYTVLLVEKASGIHMIDFDQYHFGEKQVFFISPGQIHQVNLRKRPAGWVITFSRDFLATNNISEHFITNLSLFRDFGHSPPLVADEEPFEKLCKIVLDMQACIPAELRYRRQALGALLQLFLIYCNNSCDLNTQQFNEEDSGICIFRDFKQLVEGHFRDWHKVQDYATQMVVSPKHLSTTVKSVLGKTAKEVIRERLILEAKRLLLHTDMSVKDIAYHLGFQEPFHFSNYFSKYGGQPPSAFRG